MITEMQRKYIECQMKNDWLVDVVEVNHGYITEFWLHHRSTGIKLYMFGLVTEHGEVDEIIRNLEVVSLPYRKEYEIRFID